jgi:hypothetical protein
MASFIIFTASVRTQTHKLTALVRLGSGMNSKMYGQTQLDFTGTFIETYRLFLTIYFTYSFHFGLETQRECIAQTLKKHKTSVYRVKNKFSSLRF